jgi:hypothetical protein
VARIAVELGPAERAAQYRLTRRERQGYDRPTRPSVGSNRVVLPFAFNFQEIKFNLFSSANLMHQRCL